MHKYKLKFILKQHTPIIHFQQDQLGATLRATEIKPKLDQFIMEKCLRTRGEHWSYPAHARVLFKEIAYKNRDTLRWAHWLSGDEKSQHVSLNYKLKLLPVEMDSKTISRSYGPFFGAMGENYQENPKSFHYTSIPIEGQLLVLDTTLKEEIRKHLSEFFFQQNFGTRQNKGFGAFTVIKIDGDVQKAETKQNDLYFHLNQELTAHNWYGGFQPLFEAIELFYRTLRSGVNLKDSLGDKLYIKSLMFHYARSTYQQQWDKRTVREKLYFDDPAYVDQQRGVKYRREDPDGTVHYLSEQPKDGFYLDFRDLLGLSTEQQWKHYIHSSVEKTAETEWTGESGQQIKKEIKRFKSPITFKPIYDQKQKRFTVYLLTNTIPAIYQGAKVTVTNGKHDTILKIPDHFDVADFLFKAISLFDANDIKYKGDEADGNVKEAGIIIRIFSQLEQQIRTYENG